MEKLPMSSKQKELELHEEELKISQVAKELDDTIKPYRYDLRGCKRKSNLRRLHNEVYRRFIEVLPSRRNKGLFFILGATERVDGKKCLVVSVSNFDRYHLPSRTFGQILTRVSPIPTYAFELTCFKLPQKLLLRLLGSLSHT
ncbi:unnamed protein product [Moneuplotes crassus]|uniref:Uncharacterized protein n=1 Tax=Euplotes crassus TaxID=5936 RepID=A0AAD1XRV2_EUPCR|nr:unnamed protein product [Moneuplotes crassus]